MILELGKTKQLKICAIDYYSKEFIEVKKGEVYDFSTEELPKWTDMFWRCSADGFWNPVLLNSKKRVKNTPCFKLCGTIGRDEEGHFVIGRELKGYSVLKDGQLYFFANDHYKEKYYLNNKGYILLNVTKVS